jgi:peptidoglycan hydrolase-like protein with peptidoglycan-binding domain
MFLASKIGWPGLAFTLLTTGMVVRSFPQSPAGSDSNKAGSPVFVIKDEIRKMQAALHDRQYYRGQVDGVVGMRTRASIRAYQKAESWPITGEVDTTTAKGLGIRPEST